MLDGIHALDNEGEEIVVYGKVGILNWGIYYDGFITLWIDEGDD